MKVISFLGRGEYEPVRYCYGDQACDTHLFPYAVTRFFAPTTLLVFLTPEAKTFIPKKYPPGTTATHFETLSALHHQQGLVQPQCVDIPNGASTDAEPAIVRSVPPFATLLGRVRDDYGRFGLRDPEQPRQARARLLRQLEIAAWYAAKEQIVQALSMAREWVPSLLCYCFTLDALDRDSREAMEEPLNREPHVTVNNTTYNWSDVPHGTKLRRVWSSPIKLAGLRNDVLHAGFRRNPETSQQVLEQTTKIMAELREIARLWHLGDSC